MGILQYNEATIGRFIIFDGQPYEVTASHVFRKQQRKPVNAVKMKNLITGSVTEHSFQSSDKVQEAELGSEQIKYLYENKGQYWFCAADDASNRFSLESALLGNGMPFIKANSILDAKLFEDKIIGVKLPIKVDLKVTEAAPAVKGNTAQGATKQVTLETGAHIHVPLFIKEGEILRINTGTGEYVERAN